MLGNVSGRDNEGVRVGTLQAVKLGGRILRRPLGSFDKRGDGFLQDKERETEVADWKKSEQVEAAED